MMMSQARRIFGAAVLALTLAATGCSGGPSASGPPGDGTTAAAESGPTDAPSAAQTAETGETEGVPSGGQPDGTESRTDADGSGTAARTTTGRQTTSSRAGTTTTKQGQESVAIKYSLKEYNLDAYMEPLWKGRVIYQETVLPLEKADGSIDDIPLLYKADTIVSVRKFHLGSEYAAGKDYELAGGKLRIKNGAIPRVKYSTYYPSVYTAGKTYACNGEEPYIFFSEGDVFHKMQITVTYTHSGAFQGTVPPYQGDRLPKTIARLTNKEKLHVLIYGDSICTGANSSKPVGAAPYAPAWYDMALETVRNKYGTSKVTSVNTSVGGMDSNWGAQNAKIRAADHRPDLAVIAFGMNDGTLRVTPEQFRKNIKTIMDRVREASPDCEFVLISTMVPNREVENFYGYQEDYLPELEALAGSGAVVANMTRFHKDLLKTKRFIDMTGNNINHPNDFLARAYAQLFVKTLVEDY